MNKGKIIEIEGLDCSFKETNAKLLQEYIKNNITDKVLLISFPNYESESSYFVKEYLKGTYGNLNTVDSRIASKFFALDRYDTIHKLNINNLLEQGYYIILDRYVGSNILYQTVNMESNQKYKYINEIIQYEYTELGLPKPDIEILLLNHPDIVYNILNKRKSKSVDNDIIENDKSIMYKIFDNANYVSRYLSWKKILCFTDNKTIKTKDEIFKNILELLKNKNII